jgi:hypothetical protein
MIYDMVFIYLNFSRQQAYIGRIQYYQRELSRRIQIKPIKNVKTKAIKKG